MPQRPAAVAVPRDTAEVAAVVRAAAAAGLRVAPQGTGHNAGPLGDLSDTVLLRTSAMTGARPTPRPAGSPVRGGTLWLDAVEAAAAHGRTVLHGSSPDVGVVGYSLGGGMGWYARLLGLQTNSVTGAEVVLADGSVVRTDGEREPDLFWALRGGGGSFGVVTELEFASYDFTTAYGGMLLWDWSHAEQVLPRWAAWAAQAPDDVTTSFRLMQLPPFPELPPFLRGRQLVVIDGAVRTDDDAHAEAVLAPLRALRPEIDTFARVPTASLVCLHMDPEDPRRPSPAPPCCPGCRTPLSTPFSPPPAPGLPRPARRGTAPAGGAVSRPAPGAGALPCIEGQFLLFGVAVAPDADAAAAGSASADRLVDALAPWSTGRRYLNFTEVPVPAASGYDPGSLARLRAVRAAVDPTGLFRANHPVAASDEN